MGMVVLVLPLPLSFEDYRTEVLRFLRSNTTAQSVEVRLSVDDVRHFWPFIPSPLVDVATEIARFIITLGEGQQATVILRGVWDSPKQVTRMGAAELTKPNRTIADVKAFEQCPACKRSTHPKELMSFQGRMLCSHCVYLYNRNERLVRKAKTVGLGLARALRDVALRLDSLGGL